MVVTNNPEHARTIRMLRDWGQERKYHPTLRGYNYRLQGLQAAVLRVKLKKLEAWTQARRSNAALYDRLLRETEAALPITIADVRHVYHLYTIRHPERDRLQSELASEGVPTAVHYPLPIHLLPAYRDDRYKAGDFPVAEACSKSVLSLPVHAYLTSSQVERVSEAVCKLAGRTETCPR